MIGQTATIQTDQGTDVKGVVELLSSLTNIKIIRSRLYHPRSQGKVSGKNFNLRISSNCMVHLCAVYEIA